MDAAVARILDANFNRAREALRVMEDHARFALNDETQSREVKALRHELAAVSMQFGLKTMLDARDVIGDVGTGITTESERTRDDPASVAVAAAKRAEEALRCIEEYGKTIDPVSAVTVERLRYRVYALEQALFVGGPRRTRLRKARLHVLLTASLCRREWLHVAGACLAGGADVIQLREKDLSDRELLDRARRLHEITASHEALLIVNDRPDIAALSDADGVHLGQSDLPVAEARRIVGPNRLIGKSTHDENEATRALAELPDYLGVGPMFASPTKPQVTVRGPELLATVSRLTEIPIVAIGGITAARIGDLPGVISNAGATVASPARIQIAVSHAVISADDPERATAELVAAITAS